MLYFEGLPLHTYKDKVEKVASSIRLFSIFAFHKILQILSVFSTIQINTNISPKDNKCLITEPWGEFLMSIIAGERKSRLE